MQLFSHHFDRGRYQHFFVAPRTALERRAQLAAYKRLRDGRAGTRRAAHAH
jgi:hypothetical protein